MRASGTSARYPHDGSYLAQLDVLRGLAVLAVVAFHADLPWSSGGFLGVDVFFVLSGFLITRLLVVELETTGTIAWRAFEARRVRRLWPALALVVVGTLVMGMLLWSPLDWRVLMRDAAAGAGYVANLRFAQRKVGYFNQPLEMSPYLHLWSLGVEEQFYVAWPLVLLGVAYLARRQRIDERRTLGAAIAALGTLSLALMIWLVHRHSAQVFFLTPARLWELAAGGLIGLRAVSAPRAPQTGHWYVALGLIPFIGTILFPSLRPAQPALQTIAPVAGTAFLLEGIRRGSRLPISSRAAGVLAWIGWYSYGWYLWHWPLVAGAKLFWHTDDSRYLMAASALALGMAVASKRWLEDPIRFRMRSSPLGRLPTWGVMAGAIALAGAALAANEMLERRAFQNPRVRALAHLRAGNNGLGGRAQCPHGTWVDGCILGDASSPLVVVVGGDSHAEHWLPALDSAGRVLGLKVVPHIRGGCPPWPVRVRDWYDDYEDTGCAEHQRQLVRIVAEYDAVGLVLSSAELGGFLIGPQTSEQRFQTWEQGTKSFLASLPKNVRVILVEKSPLFNFDPLGCLARYAFWNTSPACDADSARATESAVRYTELEAEAAADEEQVRIVRTIGPVCFSGACKALIGGIPVFRDEHHFTPRYALSQTGRWIPYLRWAAGLDPSDSSPPSSGGSAGEARQRPHG